MVHFKFFLFCSISGDLLRIEGKTLHSILDEVVFKLLSTPSPVIRSTATKLLLLMAESHQEILILLRLSGCYKGSVYILSFFDILKKNIFDGLWKTKYLFFEKVSNNKYVDKTLSQQIIIQEKNLYVIQPCSCLNRWHMILYWWGYNEYLYSFWQKGCVLNIPYSIIK